MKIYILPAIIIDIVGFVLSTTITANWITFSAWGISALLYFLALNEFLLYRDLAAKGWRLSFEDRWHYRISNYKPRRLLHREEARTLPEFNDDAKDIDNLENLKKMGAIHQ